MKPEDILPDAINEVTVNGVTMRKGTVAAFLHNCRSWLQTAEGSAERPQLERDIIGAVPALRELCFFEFVKLRDPRLQDLVGIH